ncbi:hypothetical protein PO124_12165 [Bacillus licheniformis]|nr:hypothetical protein [Bacillus licheniformis]
MGHDLHGIMFSNSSETASSPFKAASRTGEKESVVSLLFRYYGALHITSDRQAILLGERQNTSEMPG